LTVANKTDGGAAEKEKEEMKRKVAVLQKILYFKDHVIRKQERIIQEMKEQQKGTNLTCAASSESPNIMKHAGNKTDSAAEKEKEEMKRKVAALQKIVYFKDHVIRKQIGIIQEMKEQQRRNEEDEAPTQTHRP